MNRPDELQAVSALSADEREKLRSHAWVYFDRHAEQRLKMLNFYILLSAAITAAATAIGKDLGGAKQVWPLTLVLGIISFIFWKLDVRTRDLVWHSEAAIKMLEDGLPLPDDATGMPHRLKLFRREEASLEKIRSGPSGPSYWTYSKCFNALFFLFGFGSVAFTVFALATR